MTVYFHGGPAGLAVGTRILPPSVTGAPSSRDFGNDFCERDRVYLGVGPEHAAIYAASHYEGIGTIYEVEPEGDIEPDPDWHGPPGWSVSCESAVIVGTVPWSRFDFPPEKLRAQLLAMHRKTGRNEACFCGSGKKYKRCHGR